MRDRLIELFKKMDKNPEITCPKPDDVEACETCKYKITELLCDGLARKVDYLLANGVIVPPVKVGQTVYVVSRYYGGFWRIHKMQIDRYSSNIDGMTMLPRMNCEHWEGE